MNGGRRPFCSPGNSVRMPPWGYIRYRGPHRDAGERCTTMPHLGAMPILDTFASPLWGAVRRFHRQRRGAPPNCATGTAPRHTEPRPDQRLPGGDTVASAGCRKDGPARQSCLCSHLGAPDPLPVWRYPMQRSCRAARRVPGPRPFPNAGRLQPHGGSQIPHVPSIRNSGQAVCFGHRMASA